MRSARMRTKADYHYWLGIILISVALFWGLIDVANAEAVPTVQTLSVPDAPSHSFLSKTSVVLFGLDATAKAIDGYATARNLSNGGVEHDPIARPFTHGAASQGVYFGASLAGDIAFSYLMHRTGHHKLEKIALLVGMSNSGLCAGYSLMHHKEN